MPDFLRTALPIVALFTVAAALAVGVQHWQVAR